MEEKAQKRFEHILSLAAGDETYQQLLQQCSNLDRPLAEVLAGLPGESGEDFLDTVRWAASLPLQGVKLHNLYVPQGTALEQEWARGEYRPLEQEEYVELAARALTLLPSAVVMHRLCADPAPGELSAPAWAMDKGITVMHIDRLLAYNDWWQGKRCDAPDVNPFALEEGTAAPR
jgi:radical SAM superfamily enzyme